MSPAALCDLDGVLVDSGPVVAHAWRRFAERTGLAAGRADVVATSIADVLHLFG